MSLFPLDCMSCFFVHETHGTTGGSDLCTYKTDQIKIFIQVFVNLKKKQIIKPNRQKERPNFRFNSFYILWLRAATFYRPMADFSSQFLPNSKRAHFQQAANATRVILLSQSSIKLKQVTSSRLSLTTFSHRDELLYNNQVYF